MTEMEVKAKLAEYAARVEAAIAEEVDRMEQDSSLVTPELFAAERHSLQAGGKRIRPALIYAFCDMCGGDCIAADQAAVAMEMMHTSSLIFDDLPAMDDDDLRRGKPSCHKAFGEATAILAGTDLICHAFTALTRAELLSSEQRTQLCYELSLQAGAVGMVGGQAMDMDFEQRDYVSAEELATMCSGKTGALIATACRMGCICAGKSSFELLEKASEYGKAVGLAFQIIDDILDVIGTEEELGKPIGSDADENKKTFVSILGLDEAKRRAEELTASAHQSLDKFPNAEFLHALTDMLLVRVQ